MKSRWVQARKSAHLNIKRQKTCGLFSFKILATFVITHWILYDVILLCAQTWLWYYSKYTCTAMYKWFFLFSLCALNYTSNLFKTSIKMTNWVKNNSTLMWELNRRGMPLFIIVPLILSKSKFKSPPENQWNIIRRVHFLFDILKPEYISIWQRFSLLRLLLLASKLEEKVRSRALTFKLILQNMHNRNWICKEYACVRVCVCVCVCVRFMLLESRLCIQRLLLE